MGMHEVSMTIEQFASFVNYNDQAKQLPQYFDQHLALYTLLSELVCPGSKLIIDFKEDKDGCRYILGLPSSTDSDITYMKDFFKDLTFTLCAHHFKADVRSIKGKVSMRFLG